MGWGGVGWGVELFNGVTVQCLEKHYVTLEWPPEMKTKTIIS